MSPEFTSFVKERYELAVYSDIRKLYRQGESFGQMLLGFNLHYMSFNILIDSSCILFHTLLILEERKLSNGVEIKMRILSE